MDNFFKERNAKVGCVRDLGHIAAKNCSMHVVKGLKHYYSTQS